MENMENLNNQIPTPPENSVEKNTTDVNKDQNQRIFAAEARVAKVEDLYEKCEEESEKEQKKLTASMMVIFALLIIIITLFIISYINGAKVLSS